jgi:hypothetical protein
VSISATAFADETDSDTLNNTAFGTIEAADLNLPPSLDTALANQVATEARSFTYNTSGSFSDIDGDALTYSVQGLPGSLSINSATGIISGTPSSSDVGASPFQVTITAADPFGGSVQGAFELMVNPAPPPPPQPSGGGGGSIGFLYLMLLLLTQQLTTRIDRVRRPR